MIKQLSAFFLTASIMGAISAGEDAPVVASVTVTHPAGFRTSLPGVQLQKKVFLMPLHLTASQVQSIRNAVQFVKPFQATASASLPASHQNGMKGVAVLDQGMHGACVTFAVTAAIDSLLGQGDYISQLCNLELGNYLANNGYYPSGWEGSNADIILNQIQSFGFITKNKQNLGLCAGMTKYPLDNPWDTGRHMTLESFKEQSQSLATWGKSYFLAESLLTSQQRYQWKSDEDAHQVVDKVKAFLAADDTDAKKALVFSVSLPSRHCSAGACATFRAEDDTWAMSDEILNDPQPNGGHEMIITGYDDNASAIDHNGKKHQGLLTLRNSWGDTVGDAGNYYMTYDFFSTYVSDIHALFLFHS